MDAVECLVYFLRNHFFQKMLGHASVKNRKSKDNTKNIFSLNEHQNYQNRLLRRKLTFNKVRVTHICRLTSCKVNRCSYSLCNIPEKNKIYFAVLIMMHK